MNKLIIVGIILVPIILVGFGANMMSEHANEREQRLSQSHLASDSRNSTSNNLLEKSIIDKRNSFP